MNKYIKPEVIEELITIDDVICLSNGGNLDVDHGPQYGVDDGFWDL